MDGLFRLDMKNQHGICTVVKAELDHFTGETICEMPGFEFIIPNEILESIKFRGQSQKPHPGNLLIFNALERHTETFRQATGKLQSIVINKDYVDNVCSSLNIEAREILFEKADQEQSQALQNLVVKLLQLANYNTPMSRFSFDCLAAELVVLALTSFKHTHSKKIESNVVSGHFPKMCDKIKKIMHDHISISQFNLDQLSHEAGLSKFHLIRSFSKAVGISPAKYLATLKIDIAKQRLKSTKNSVISISTELGFDNISTFNKSFKAMTGMSPNQFRKLAV